MTGHHIAQRPVVYKPASTLMPEVARRAYDRANEWFTPFDLCAAVRAVLDGIELDPASCAEANAVVQAERFYTQEDDGLAQSWRCRSLYMNPPFGTTGRPVAAAYQGQSISAMFLAKLWREWQAGHIGSAIVLSKADPKSRNFHPIWNERRLTCFCNDRVYFHRPGRQPEKIMFGTCLTLLTRDPEREARFIEVFRQFGRIARAVDPDPEPPPWASPELWSA